MGLEFAQGFGTVGLRTLGEAGLNAIPALNQKVYGLPLMSFEYVRTATTEDVKAFRGGKLSIESSFENEVERTLTLKTEIPTWNLSGLARNQMERTLSGITVPVVKRVKVPASGIITDPLITANLPVVMAVETVGVWGQAGPIPNAAITRAAGTLTLTAPYIGAIVTYFYDREIATARAYGGPGAIQYLGQFEFIGELYKAGTSYDQSFIYLPLIERKNSNVNLIFSGSKVEYEMEFNAIVPPGWEEADLEVDGKSIVWTV